jgi:hypothetical protein
MLLHTTPIILAKTAALIISLKNNPKDEAISGAGLVGWDTKWQ